MAPITGWLVYTAFAASLLPITGLGALSVELGALLPLLAVWIWHAALNCPNSSPRFPAILLVLAAVLACLPAAAILPKFGVGLVRLSAPIFDHSKIAMIDSMLREGLPPANPFYSGSDSPPHLAYYYWWHLTAAALASLSGIGGWGADAAMTWFTAYASLALIGGLAYVLMPASGWLAMLLALPASLRAFLQSLEHGGWLLPGGGFGGWLNQASWAPQHLAAACGLVTIGLLIAGIAEMPGLAGAATLGVAIASSFGSSVWIGGIVCALAAPAAVLAVLTATPRDRRKVALAWIAAGAALGIVLSLPLMRSEYAAGLARGTPPIALMPYPIFGPRLGKSPFLDVVGFPLLLLIELPAVTLLGGLGAIRALGSGVASWQRALLAIAAVASLTCLCLRSTIDNNDLGWRAALLPILVLLPYAAGTALRFWREGRWHAVLAATPMLGLATTWPQLRENLIAHAEPSQQVFAEEPAMWRAVRSLTKPEDRLATDPIIDSDLTPWPANIGWALLADRASCYAGWATAHPFVPVPPGRLYQIDQMFRRIFDGTSTSSDLATLTAASGCTIALITRRSPAWLHDPFATAAGWASVIKTPDWRLYRRITKRASDGS